MTAAAFFSLAPGRLVAAWRRWLYTRLESHYLICAETEKQKADEALENVRYYQAKAAIARSNRI